MRAPAAPLCLAVIAGTLLPAVARPPLLLCLSLAPLVLGGALLAAERDRLRTGSFLICAAFVLLGSFSESLRQRSIAESPLRRVYALYGEAAFASPQRITGRLRIEPDSRDDATLLLVDVETVVLRRRLVRARGGLRFTVRGTRRAGLDDLVAGEQVTLWAVIREPEFFENPGSFDGTGYFERHGIDLIGSVKSGLLVKRASPHEEVPAVFSRLRRRVLSRLDGGIRSPEAFGVVAALVTGVRADLSPELSRLYQRAGIFHVMAISGAHVAIWTLVLHSLLRGVGFSTRTTIVVLLVLLPLYAAFCGSRAPVVRAVVMASALMAARLASLRGPIGNALALAALGLLLWQPANLSDAGFQLTMAAMTGIAVFHEPFTERLAWAGFLAKPLAVSLAAQLGVVPVAAWHFHRLSPAAPVASLVAIPVAASICILGVVLVLVAGIPVLSSVVGATTRFAVAILTAVAEVAAELPAASIRVGAPSWWFIVVYLMALVLLRGTSKRLRWGGGAVLGGLFVVALVPYQPATNTLEVTALDVGHGDAIVLSLPTGETVLVDGGGLPMSSLDVGESVVLPYLLDRGVRRLDAVVVTHADFDHIGGLNAIVNEIRVDALWQGNLDGADKERSAYRALHSSAEERNVPVRTLRTGERFELGGARFEVVAAGDDLAGTSNDRSIVLRVGFAGRWVLLTGDAEASLEQRLVESRLDVEADVLKLGHHGSRTSTTEAFLDAVQPKLAIVSARENRNRLIPSPLVLERLRERGIVYARTDQHGAVTVRIDSAGQIELSTYLSDN